MATYIVYKTVNTTNGKYYIGKHRLQGNSFDYYFGSGPAVQQAIQKYGVSNFERMTLFETDNEQDCYTKEQELLGDLWLTDKNCYNKQPGGKGFSSGLDHYTQGQGFSESHLKNLKKARRLRPPHSEETKQKMIESRTGQKRTLEQRKTMSEAQKKNNARLKGTFRSNEDKEKISEGLKGKYTGEKSSSFKGYYITPFGKFATLREASEHIDIISKGTIRTWCKNENKKITKNMIGISKYLTEDMLNKTFKDIGFYFEKQNIHGRECRLS